MWNPFALPISRSIVEEVVSRETCVPVKFVNPAVKTVRAALGDERYLRAGGTALRGIWVCGSDAKFLNRIRRHAEHARKRLILVVYKIGYDVEASLLFV